MPLTFFGYSAGELFENSYIIHTPPTLISTSPEPFTESNRRNGCWATLTPMKRSSGSLKQEEKWFLFIKMHRHLRRFTLIDHTEIFTANQLNFRNCKPWCFSQGRWPQL